MSAFYQTTRTFPDTSWHSIRKGSSGVYGTVMIIGGSIVLGTGTIWLVGVPQRRKSVFAKLQPRYREICSVLELHWRRLCKVRSKNLNFHSAKIPGASTAEDALVCYSDFSLAIKGFLVRKISLNHFEPVVPAPKHFKPPM